MLTMFCQSKPFSDQNSTLCRLPELSTIVTSKDVIAWNSLKVLQCDIKVVIVNFLFLVFCFILFKYFLYVMIKTTVNMICC